MNPRTFLQEFEESAARDRLVNVVYEEMLAYCAKQGITVDDVGYDELEQLAEGVVQRGLGVPESDDTIAAERDWRSA